MIDPVMLQSLKQKATKDGDLQNMKLCFYFLLPRQAKFERKNGQMYPLNINLLVPNKILVNTYELVYFMDNYVI